MKTIKILLLAFVFSIAFAGSCEPEEPQTTMQPIEQCDCVKIYYQYYPAMGNGPSYIPARYEIVDTQVGNFNCEDETADYIPVSNSQYSHYKIVCD